MSIQSSDNFKILGELDSAEFYSAFSAIHVPTSTPVRLTRMTAEISESSEFRAAFRKDEASLRALQHANVLPLLFWGEDAGLLFYATERPAGQSLSHRLQQRLLFQWDEFTDIGWQIASAVQHAHNRGITHGGLTADSIIISDELVVKVVGFGLHHWIAEAHDVSRTPPTFQELIEQDLINFGALLATLLAAVDPASDPPANVQQLIEIRQLITILKEPHKDFTARDVQGRLGDMLLNVAGESIRMIDDRKGLGLSRRSIVDELFDDADGTNEADSDHATRPQLSRNRVYFWVIIMVIIALGATYLMTTES